MTLFMTRCLLGLSEHGTEKTTLCWGNLALVASTRPCSKNCVAVMLLPAHTLSGHTGAVDIFVARHKGAPKS